MSSGVAGVPLLPIRHPDLWLGGHDHAGLGAIDAGLPRPLGARDLAVLELLRVLAHVPDVAERCPARTSRACPRSVSPFQADDVVDDRGLDAEDLLRLVEHRSRRLDWTLRLAICLGVDPAAAARKRPVRVVRSGTPANSAGSSSIASLPVGEAMGVAVAVGAGVGGVADDATDAAADGEAAIDGAGDEVAVVPPQPATRTTRGRGTRDPADHGTDARSRSPTRGSSAVRQRRSP